MNVKRGIHTKRHNKRFILSNSGQDTMATKRLSPTANLLRHSRLFSLPPPLPRPSSEYTFQSNSATLPYPTNAAIETTQSSLSRGDWGLKRPLPQKSTTNTTTPIIRVSAVDTIDHITDFDSAADYALTLRKWQEMNIPISMPYRNQKASAMNIPRPSPSVFEERFNSSQPSPEGTKGEASRWKFRGPWLAGETEGNFQEYIKKQIKRRRPEFQRYLRAWLIKRRAVFARRIAMAEGRELGNEEQEESQKLTDEQFQEEVIKLRQEPLDLWAVIWEFLDLPGHPPVEVQLSEGYQSVDRNAEIDQGPPLTHPSAGLSYLRTASHVPNHPVLGPMRTEPPIHSRILQSASSRGNRDNRVVLGVGGIVAADSSGSIFRADEGLEDPGWSSFEPDVEGGAKTWVHPNQASIDPTGKIRLSANRASPDTVAVWEAQVDKRYDMPDEMKGENRRAATDFTDFFQNTFGREDGQNKSKPKRKSPYASQLPEGSTQELLDLVRQASPNVSRK